MNCQQADLLVFVFIVIVHGNASSTLWLQVWRPFHVKGGLLAGLFA